MRVECLLWRYRVSHPGFLETGACGPSTCASPPGDDNSLTIPCETSGSVHTLLGCDRGIPPDWFFKPPASLPLLLVWAAARVIPRTLCQGQLQNLLTTKSTAELCRLTAGSVVGIGEESLRAGISTTIRGSACKTGPECRSAD
jgi:hypothetical protein